MAEWPQYVKKRQVLRALSLLLLVSDTYWSDVLLCALVVETTDLVGCGEHAHGHDAYCEGDGTEDHLPWPRRTHLTMGPEQTRQHLEFL